MVPTGPAMLMSRIADESFSMFTSMVGMSGSVETISVHNVLTPSASIGASYFSECWAMCSRTKVEVCSAAVLLRSSASADCRLTRLARCTAETAIVTRATSATINRTRRTRRDMRAVLIQLWRSARRSPVSLMWTRTNDSCSGRYTPAVCAPYSFNLLNSVF